MPRTTTGLSAEKVNELARYGAAARIKELEAEIAAIQAAFLDTLGPRRGRPANKNRSAERMQPSASTSGRRRRTMSAAARRAVSERMKRYWAQRRKAKGKSQ